MDFCTCTITLGGDSRSQVQIPPRKKVSYAELVLLRVIHGGPETVRDVRVVDSMPINTGAEKTYLTSKYNPETVNTLYPGIQPSMPESAAEDPYLAEPVSRSAPAPESEGRKRKSGSAGDGFPA